MPDSVLEGLAELAAVLEICGAGFLILGFIFDTLRWFKQMYQTGFQSALHHYRQSLGRSVLIGLEILVAATIIKTITVEPTLEGMGLLAGMVMVRAMLGWTTALEINGRWPWQSQ